LLDNGIDTARVSIRSNSISLIVSLLETGKYLTIMSPQVCRTELNAGKLTVLKPLPREVERKIGLYFLASSSLKPLGESLVEQLKQALKEPTP
jgi:DNA-binding transcriptional LysR family regulator